MSHLSHFLHEPPEPDGFHDLSPGEALELVREAPEDLCILDVRTPREHASHRIPGSTLVPIQELMARARDLDPDRPTLVYCEHGIRSIQATAFLRALGFERLYHLRGGIVRWKGNKEGHACG
jgi:rhodanese-related sulfurtransferase